MDYGILNLGSHTYEARALPTETSSHPLARHLVNKKWKPPHEMDTTGYADQNRVFFSVPNPFVFKFLFRIICYIVLSQQLFTK